MCTLLKIFIMNFQVLIESNMKLFLCYVQNYEIL